MSRRSKKQIKNDLIKIRRKVESKSQQQLKSFLSIYSAGHLGQALQHPNTLRDAETGIAYIKSVWGSALNVVNKNNNPSDEIKDKASAIEAHILNYDFGVYTKIDIEVVYTYLVLYERTRIKVS